MEQLRWITMLLPLWSSSKIEDLPLIWGEAVSSSKDFVSVCYIFWNIICFAKICVGFFVRVCLTSNCDVAITKHWTIIWLIVNGFIVFIYFHLAFEWSNGLFVSKRKNKGLSSGAIAFFGFWRKRQCRFSSTKSFFSHPCTKSLVKQTDRSTANQAVIVW